MTKTYTRSPTLKVRKKLSETMKAFARTEAGRKRARDAERLLKARANGAKR